VDFSPVASSSVGSEACERTIKEKVVAYFRTAGDKEGQVDELRSSEQGPAKNGASEAPVVLATPVIPAAADLSSGTTIAIVYDCLVGTSICEMLNRTSRTSTASCSVGISGTKISRILDGRCLNTIVRTRPICAASRDASSAEIPANILAPKKIPPSVAASTPSANRTSTRRNPVRRNRHQKRRGQRERQAGRQPIGRCLCPGGASSLRNVGRQSALRLLPKGC